MQSFAEKLESIQDALRKQSLDGWLLYDFRRSNPLACKLLGLDEGILLSRRFFYWIPVQGEPLKLVHRVEAHHLDHLPGKKHAYSSWRELETQLALALQGKGRVAMEYSPRNAIPTVSRVDAGTLEVIRSFGVEVCSSADLLQRESIWTAEQLETHYYAARVLDSAVAGAWEFIGARLAAAEAVSEYEVQQFIISRFQEAGCVWAGDPIVAVNAHAADPHYTPSENRFAQIQKGDWVLIDLWCKRKEPRAVYADITRVGVADSKPTERQQEIFGIVKAARDAGARLVQERFEADEPVMGWEVDQAVRDVIDEAGYGEYFVHRTGHSIDTNDHGDGANIDNLETQDRRCILPGTCFSIEPGIYLPGEFGVRLEYDVFVHPDGRV
ncbi:MAG: M24 family metallopeptidase, partial [Chlamydiia bacterium]|nr:M24 family metallopeptidase [Chlamydiia bacterium]